MNVMDSANETVLPDAAGAHTILCRLNKRGLCEVKAGRKMLWPSSS